MSLASNLTTAFIRVATEFKSIRTLIGGSATSTTAGLTTIDKSSLVAAINEVKTGSTGTPPDATDSTKGIVELATIAETVTGIDTTRAVVPAGVSSAISGKANTASLASIAFSGSASDITSGTLPSSVLPPLAVNKTDVVATQAAMLALISERGDLAIRTDVGKTYVLATDSPTTLADWKEITAAGAVQSVAGKSGTVNLVKADVGLDNVDNTSDVNKPVSVATQTALNLKANADTVYNRTEIGDPNTDFAAGFVSALA